MLQIQRENLGGNLEIAEAEKMKVCEGWVMLYRCFFKLTCTKFDFEMNSQSLMRASNDARLTHLRLAPASPEQMAGKLKF